jgi:amino acid transporter
MGLSVERYVQDTQLGLSCLDICYGPSIKILKKNGVYFAIAFSLLTIIYWLIRKRRKAAPSFRRPLSTTGKQLLIFVGVLLFTSIFFALFLTISGGIELRRTVLPAVLFQLAAISYLIINRHELMVAKHDNNQIAK